jgi:UDP-N-acetylmuramoyl-tripeptide--D-alanyl-D-alanine ligase
MATPIPKNQAPFTFAELALVLGLPHGVSERLGICGITTDTRAVTPGALFVALVGEQHDGHAYVKSAIDGGAAAIVAERDVGELGVPVFRVQNTLEALGALARAHLERWRRASSTRRIVAITGSSGKTTTKELTAALLGLRANVVRTAGNLNNRIGLPCTALTVTEADTFVVLEAGMSLRGEMQKLAQIARPDVACVVNIGYAHAENLGGIEGVAVEKGALYDGLQEGTGYAVACGDDERVLRAAATRKVRTVQFGRSANAAYRLIERTPTDTGVRLQFSRAKAGAEAELLACDLRYLAEHQAIDLMAALAIAEQCVAEHQAEFSPEEIAAAVASVVFSGRGTFELTARKVTLIDDTYNANPASMQAALTMLKEVARGARTVAVVGDMKELGEVAEAAHREIGRLAAKLGIHALITCGGLSNLAAEEAAKLGVWVARAQSVTEAADAAVTFLEAGDFVLVKASRSVGAERVCERLRSLP